MTFKREWDSTCPREWVRWEADGKTWVIQDLKPEDDEEAVNLLVDHLVPDEALCSASNHYEDEASIRSISEYWRFCLAQRTSLGCYTEVEGKNTLVAMNCCIVATAGDNDEPVKIEGEAWQNVYNAMKYISSKLDVHEYLGMEKVLYAMGLVVRRDFRGAKLGSKLLAAREPLCQSLGLKGSSTIFTGVASQKSASRAGFKTAVEVTMKELAESGLNYPKTDHVIKLMVKKYI